MCTNKQTNNNKIPIEAKKTHFMFKLISFIHNACLFFFFVINTTYNQKCLATLWRNIFTSERVFVLVMLLKTEQPDRHTKQKRKRERENIYNE